MEQPNHRYKLIRFEIVTYFELRKFKLLSICGTLLKSIKKLNKNKKMKAIL